MDQAGHCGRSRSARERRRSRAKKAAQIGVVTREQQAYRDIKTALDKIGEAEDDILDSWVVVGERLAELKEKYPKFDGSFISNCRLHSIVLTSEERSAAIWWAKLTAEQRATLRNEFPDRLTVVGLRNGAREIHPEWMKSAKSIASHPVRSDKNHRLKAKQAVPSRHRTTKMTHRSSWTPPPKERRQIDNSKNRPNESRAATQSLPSR